MHVEINDKKKELFLGKYCAVLVKYSGVLSGVWFEGGVDGSCSRPFIYLIWGYCEIP